MNKIQLTVPKPCHENWDQMSMAERGRFCGSCQKTVIDFTHMTDREMAAFFKRPSASLCGRFREDQLGRPIPVPRRLPWIKYFFQVTWPAFLFSLKSCTSVTDRWRAGTIGQVQQNITGDTIMTSTMGVILPDVLHIDTVKSPVQQENEKKESGKAVQREEPHHIAGDLVVTTAERIPVHLKCKVGEGEDSPNYKSLDTVTINTPSRVLMGRVAKGKPVVTQQQDSTLKTVEIRESETVAFETSFLVFPNPVRRGFVLKVAAKKGIPISFLQLWTASGQLLISHDAAGVSHSVQTLELPGSMASGVYFLHVGTLDGDVEKVKVVVVE